MISEEQKNSKVVEFYVRTASAVVLFPPVFYSVYNGGMLYFSLLFIVVILTGWEWNKIAGNWSFGIDSMFLITVVMLVMTTSFMDHLSVGIVIMLLGAYITYVLSKIRAKSEKTHVIPEYINRPNWFFWGTIYLSLAFLGLAYIINTDYTGLTMIWVFLATICNDIFAYIFGSIIKGKKIAPKISPGKSWSGFIAAALSTTILSYFFAVSIGSNNELLIMAIGFFMAFFAHFGDMLESSFKRYLKIKDTSNLIPGHGGILDRIDAVIMVALFISIVSIILGVSPLYLK